MPAKNPVIPESVAEQLHALGRSIRQQRKALKVSATVAAESARMSRVTWHRIEKGEPSVTMGAYLNAMAVLNLGFGILPSPGSPQTSEAQNDRVGWIPARIRLNDYPQLKQLAWHVQGAGELTAREALDIYARNIRHLDPAAMVLAERQLLDALREGFGVSSSEL